ncbi:MAG TPA: Hsp70 family protein, partial [Planctomycetota bacterium]|nr:Hsp70 family protein [Planctomycetota bacterium]
MAKEEKLSRYVIGIDLGTTNSALAYVDRRSGRAATKVRDFAIPQLTAPGEVQARRLLPSFVYLTGDFELAEDATRLPFGEARGWVVGELARGQGARVPGRLVASSKSWLCHDRVDRRAPILPWNGAPDGPRISPVEAGARVLAHLRDAWDFSIAAGDEQKRFVAQDVVLCVPASFDAVARRLTLDAANAMGLARPVLLEEPQAALYAWIAANEGHVEEAAPPGSLILVVDVGGGTTDFALVAVREGMVFERTAVSDHLLLGGDNMDLALARFMEPHVKQGGPELDSRDWNALRHACRSAKEQLLAADGPGQATVTLLGSGTKLVGGSRSAELSREAVHMLALEGFFPEVELDDTTPKRSRTGLQEIGLPFVSDPAITRHMGSFLRRHAPEGQPLAMPTHVLFNGGVVTNTLVRERLLSTLTRWGGARPQELVAESYDLAVAKGAAYYGLVRRDRGLRIRGGLGRAYYVGVDTGAKEPTPLCLTPRGLEAEKPVAVKLGMLLQANVPVQFPFFFSSSRQDKPGDLAVDARVATESEEGDLEELPPLVTVLRSGAKRTSERKEIAVELEARLTELGVLELACHAVDGTDRRWNLELSVRKAGEETKRRTREELGARASALSASPGSEGREASPAEADAPVDAAKMARAREVLATAFGGPGDAHGPLGRVGRDLEEVFGTKREGWSLALCRALFEAIFEQREQRRKSPEHEQRFWNLAAFCLRPGFGAVLDDHR